MEYCESCGQKYELEDLTTTDDGEELCAECVRELAGDQEEE